jgi:radical SAM superfamily enzyme YgiQ (UPF0313 family)
MERATETIRTSDRPADRSGRGARKLRVCLITALSMVDFVDAELTANGAKRIMPGNVGVLALAAVLREHGYEPHIVNLDQLFLDFRNQTAGCTDDRHAGNTGPDSVYFFEMAAERLSALSFDVFGFSSICSSYPLTLRLAAEVRTFNPDAQIILGGPQASVVDVATMQAFPCVDFVVRGEADRTLPALLDLLSSQMRGTDLESVPGVTFRREGRVIRNANALPIDDMDLLPLPAFDLDPEVDKRGSVYLEAGRGCPFVCTFCSTNDFFRRNFRLKSPGKMIEHMKAIRQKYGTSTFNLIHDMYTVDRKRVVGFCEALLASGERFTWACSARTDCVDDELIELMARAGCRGIFFGIETGSSRLQVVINKKLDLAEAMQHIQCADRYGIRTAVALIIAYPEETRDDLRDTIHFFIDSLRFDNAEPQLSLLAPLAATPIYEQHKHHLVLDHIFSDMSHQGWLQDPRDISLIEAHPDIFPNFYAAPTQFIERGYFKEVRDWVTYLATRFRWLPVALLRDSKDLLGVFDRWKTWLTENRAGLATSDSGTAPYYCRDQFRVDFLEFVRTSYLKEASSAGRLVVSTLIQTEDAELGICSPTRSVERAGCLDDACFPFLADRLFTMDLRADYNDIISSLRVDPDICLPPEREVTVIFRPVDGKPTEVWQLAALSAALIRLCNGTRTAREIIQEFALAGPEAGGVPAEQAGLFGLMALQAEGFIEISRSPAAPGDATQAGDAAGRALTRYSQPPQMSNTTQPWPWGAPGSVESTP